MLITASRPLTLPHPPSSTCTARVHAMAHEGELPIAVWAQTASRLPAVPASFDVNGSRTPLSLTAGARDGPLGDRA